MTRNGRILRYQAILAYERKITEHQHALDTIKSIPTDKMLHIVRPTFTVEIRNVRPTHTTWIDGGWIVIPRKWNLDSLRCHVLAIEYPGFDANKIVTDPNGTFLDAIRFLDIRSWHLFNPNDAGLYVNWAALSEDFKRIAFNK